VSSLSTCINYPEISSDVLDRAVNNKPKIISLFGCLKDRILVQPFKTHRAIEKIHQPQALSRFKNEGNAYNPPLFHDMIKSYNDPLFCRHRSSLYSPLLPSAPLLWPTKRPSTLASALLTARTRDSSTTYATNPPTLTYTSNLTYFYLVFC
jgi:hypothetical protein